MMDVEKDIYLLLDKLKKQGVLEEYHYFSNEVINSYREFWKNKNENDLNASLLIVIIEKTAKKYEFFKNLTEYEQELIGALILGYLDER